MTFRPLPARAPAALLREAKPLKALFNQAQRIDRLQHLLESQLQPAAREHCHVASWREGCLLLIITDGHWATRLRYQQKRLLKQLQGTRRVRDLNQDPVQGATSDCRKARTSVAHSACPAAPRENIQATAEGISDPKLRAALERLAKHAKPSE